MLLRLDGLMQTLAVTAAEHEAAGELIDDDDLAVLHDIVDVALHDAVGLQRLVDVVRERGVFEVCKVFQPERRLRLGDAAGGERGGARLLVHDVVGVQILVLFLLLIDGGVDLHLQARDEILRAGIEVGALVALAGNDERRSRLVDEDGVHLVHDGEGMAALHHLRLVDRHVVAQIVKAHLVVRAVGDIGGIGLAALRVRKSVDDQAYGQAEVAIDLAHPLAVALGEVVVDRDDVHALAGDGV